MKIYVYPADQTGCGYYRLIWPAQSLAAAGIDVTVVTDKNSPHMFQAKMVGRDQMIDVIMPPDADVVVLQRPTHKFLVQAIPLMRRKGVAVVIDMDDDLSAIDANNPAFSIMHPRLGSEHSWQNVQEACESATLVTVSAPSLLNVYARRTAGDVLPNYVPRAFTEYRPVELMPFVGWAGAIFSHPNDLQQMGPTISKVLREFGTFRLIGPGDRLETVVGSTLADKIDVVGKIEFLDWHKGLADHIGVGVAPTANTRFNRAKSWLKPLEYASVGVVPISSERVEYVRLQRDYGIGFIAPTTKDWYRTISQLLKNEGERVALSEMWRQVVVDHLTIERNAFKWLESWTRALTIQRS